jgi:putative FmdB family regulatory protein
MPLYEYECPRCGRFEELQKLGASPLRTHTCGSRVRKVMSAGAFTLKGSGFHANDYARKAAPSCERPEKGSSGACASCPAAEA